MKATRPESLTHGFELRLARRILRTWQPHQPHRSPGRKQLPSLLSPGMSKETEQPLRTGYQWQPRLTPDSFIAYVCIPRAKCAGKSGGFGGGLFHKAACAASSVSILALKLELLGGAAWLLRLLLPSLALHRTQLPSQAGKATQRSLIHTVNFTSAPGARSGLGSREGGKEGNKQTRVHP